MLRLPSSTQHLSLRIQPCSLEIEMIDDILTSAERLRFDELPTSLSADDIVRYFTLSNAVLALR